MYDSYKIARDMSWEVLLKCGINRLPVDLGLIANCYRYKIILFSKTNITQILKKDVLSGDGFIIYNNNEKQIFINDKINNRARRRFTLAHELGHGVLNHDIEQIHYRNNEIDNSDDLQELQANVFARDLLMPATVLAALNVHTADEIMKLCSVSKVSAEIRADRLKELYKRNMFNKHPLERKVRAMFEEYIINYFNK